MKVLDDILKHVNAWSEAHKLRKPANPVFEEPVREKAFKPDANEKHDPKNGQFTSSAANAGHGRGKLGQVSNSRAQGIARERHESNEKRTAAYIAARKKARAEGKSEEEIKAAGEKAWRGGALGTRKPDANEKHDPKTGQFSGGSTKVPGTNRRVAVGRVERESQNRASRSGPPKFKKGPLPMTRGGYVDAVGQKPQPPMKAVGATKSILEPKKQVPDAMKRADKHLGFKKLENKLAHKPGITNPAAVAAAIGRKKFGAKGMAAKAAAGRK